MGANDKLAAALHPRIFTCEDCGTQWESQAAANECAILDAAEARNARHPAHDRRPERYYLSED